jgi:hypothetical protein
MGEAQGMRARSVTAVESGTSRTRICLIFVWEKALAIYLAVKNAVRVGLGTHNGKQSKKSGSFTRSSTFFEFVPPIPSLSLSGWSEREPKK